MIVEEGKMDRTEKLTEELRSFQQLWPKGFYAGDPQNPAFGLWGITSFIGVSHAIYLGCIKPYVSASTDVLEIGCGRGAWSRLMKQCHQLNCVDALDADHNGFWEYVGRQPNIAYTKVSDFSLSNIAPDSIDFCFSYDALCHVSFEGISSYAQSLYPRLRRGGHAVWMVADYEKFNRFVDAQDAYSALNVLLPRENKLVRSILSAVFGKVVSWNARRFNCLPKTVAEDDTPRPGRWYNAGTARTCEMLKRTGYTIVDADMGFDYRSPLIHFRKD